MNAENYVKAFQGVMGVYGLQFLLVPKKIVRFSLLSLSLSLSFARVVVVVVESVLLKLFHFSSRIGRQNKRKEPLPLERARAN
jgi:hypothetical protein